MSKKEKDLELDSMRHSAAHVLASAVLELFPDTKLGIGPTIEDGFYYDFDFKSPLSPSDLKKIEKKMREIIKKNLPFKKEELSVKDGIKLFKDLKQPYKVELIKDLEKEGEKKVSIYRTGDFADLCKGPHVKSTKEVKAFRLDKVAGAYWKGDEKNKMLQRIYGIAFNTKEELQKYLKMMEEAKKRDHRKIGKELELFFFHSAAPGDPFWQPKGLILIKELFKYWREIHEREGYVEVRTPEILTRKVWDQSGHTDFFIEKIYKVTTPDSKEWNMAIKPMNCDGGIIIYKTRLRSYKEFPLRMGELGV
ncbi:threonine--tRNA ligase, partial [bacterium (Candidatus Torokbacteria) CG_4_10_14_0_2_um_filter_35_8]